MTTTYAIWAAGIVPARRDESGWKVLVLRAHYTMDVFAAALAAFFAYNLGAAIAPGVDAWIRSAL